MSPGYMKMLWWGSAGWAWALFLETLRASATLTTVESLFPKPFYRLCSLGETWGQSPRPGHPLCTQAQV